MRQLYILEIATVTKSLTLSQRWLRVNIYTDLTYSGVFELSPRPLPEHISPGNIHHALFIHDCFVIDSASFVLGGSRNLHSAGVKSDNEKCPFRGRASVVVSVAAIIHSCAGFVCFLCHGYIHAGDGLGGVIPASGINSGAAFLHSRAGFIGTLSRLYSRR